LNCIDHAAYAQILAGNLNIGMSPEASMLGSTRHKANGRYVDNNKKAKTMNLRGTLALWLGKLRIYVSVSISH
jgi:hypothetical protein